MKRFLAKKSGAVEIWFVRCKRDASSFIVSDDLNRFRLKAFPSILGFAVNRFVSQETAGRSRRCLQKREI
jgi:hypothetical protein